MELFMAEQRGNCLNRLTEIQDDRNNKINLLRQALNTIRLGKDTKSFCAILIRNWWSINVLLNKMMKFCFTSRSRRMKKISNI